MPQKVKHTTQNANLSVGRLTTDTWIRHDGTWGAYVGGFNNLPGAYGDATDKSKKAALIEALKKLLIIVEEEEQVIIKRLKLVQRALTKAEKQRAK